MEKEKLIELLYQFLDKQIENCDLQAEQFTKIGAETSAISSAAMGTAYWVVKQFIEVNDI
jgi:hypothetical protein